MRLIWIAPVIPAVATVVTALGETLVRGQGRRRAWAAIGLAVGAILLAHPLAQGMTLVTERAQLRKDEAARSPAPWRDLLVFLGQDPRTRVLASDPVTSYSIPAFTGHQVMAYYDQHSSPNDPSGLTRILDARSVFSPFVDLRRTIEILRAYGVDAVVLNGRFDRIPATDYWNMTPDLYDSSLAKFRARPDLFRPVFDASKAWVFELTDAARQGPLPDSSVAAFRPWLLRNQRRALLATVRGEWPPVDVDPGPVRERPTREGAFLLYATALSKPGVPRWEAGFGTKSEFAPLDTLEVVTAWGLADSVAMPPGNYAIYVRLDAHAMPRGPLYADAWDKPYRKVLEKISGKRWRVRSAHRLLDGMYGPDEWQPADRVIDRTQIVIPANLVPGTYDLGVALVRTPHYTNTRISDYLHDHDEFSGRVVGQVRIAPRTQAVR
jgi:hypothetical protein